MNIKKELILVLLVINFGANAEQQENNDQKITKWIIDSVIKGSESNKKGWIVSEGVEHFVSKYKSLDDEPLVRIRTELLNAKEAARALEQGDYTPNTNLPQEIVRALSNQMDVFKSNEKKAGFGIFIAIDKHTRCRTKTHANIHEIFNNFACECVTVLPEHEFEAIKKEIQDRKKTLQITAEK